MPKFSIVIPVYSELGGNHFRRRSISRLLESIVNQSYPDFEVIVVDDGSADPQMLPLLYEWAAKDYRIQVLTQPNQQRAVARNHGMGAATGEWICWADSDDQYTRDYLHLVNRAIESDPDYKIFFFGAIIDWQSHIEIRHAPQIPEDGEGHIFFRSGLINTGSFVFKRELLEDPHNWIPNSMSPYQFAADSKVNLQLPADEPYVDNPTEAFSDGVLRHGLSLGNPWGDDWLQVYKLTRKHHAKSVDIPIYIIYPRGGSDPLVMEPDED